MRKQSSMTAFTKKTPPSTSGHKVRPIAAVSGVKRPVEDRPGIRSPEDAQMLGRQSKFRKLIGDGESKDQESYR